MPVPSELRGAWIGYMGHTTALWQKTHLYRPLRCLPRAPRGVMHGFTRGVASPQGFVNLAAGFSPAARRVRQPTAGLKPAATATKAAAAAYPQNLHHTLLLGV
jgi:hypothetical protein